MKLTPEMPIPSRIAAIEEALAQILDRGGEMSVEPCEPAGDRAVYVISEPWSDRRTRFNLYQLAREMEVLLS